MSALLQQLLPRGEQPAVRAGTTTFTRSQLRSAALELARGLRDQGVTARSCVLFRVPPGPDFVRHLLATLLTGAQVFVIDHRLSGDVVHHAVRLAGATHDVASASPLAPTRGYSVAPTLVRRLPGLGRRSDDLLVQLSSGTTNEPKLIARTEADVVDELERYRGAGGIAPEGGGVVVACALASAWGLYGGLVAGLGSGLELAFPESLTLRGIVEAVDRSGRPTVVLGVPIHVDMLSSWKDAPRRLAGVVTSGATLSLDQVERASAALGGVPIGQVYGMTEVGMIAADPRGEVPGSVGRFAAGLRTRLGGRAELEIALPRSPYLNGRGDDGRWVDGWFRTRDAVSIDPSGVVGVQGRLDGLVSLGGKKFHVTEIEHYLRGDPLVEEVVAFVDGGRIEAFVSVPAGRRFDRAGALSRLPEYMRPHVIQVVDQLPRTVSGKVLRRRDLLPGTRG